MRKEAQIPLFLWVASALVVHGVGGGGATQVAHHIEQASLLESFASQVKKHAASTTQGLEVTLLEDATEPLDTEPDEANDPTADESDVVTEDEVEVSEIPPAPQPEPEPEPETEVADAEKAEERRPTADLPDLTIQPPVDNRRIAVDQQVDDPNQDDNPDAEFAAEHAHHVDRQTRARMSATDGSTSPPQMGGPDTNAGPEPGNALEDEFGQSSESEGRDDALADAASQKPSEPQSDASTAQQTPPDAKPTASASQQAARSASAPHQQAQKAHEAHNLQSPMAETLTSDRGGGAIAQAREERAQSSEQQARKRIPPSARTENRAMFGLGSQGTTERGVNLNLSFSQAHSIVGADTLERLKQQNGERRLSQHRGKWQSLGLDKWKPALENYVANVQPGNQTALNTARVPFARYLNQIHQRLHQVFAHRFLGHLDDLPANHPLNNMDMSTHLEIALSPEDGRVVRMGVTKSSGVTMFDVGALDSVERAAPYGVPPSSIVSSDGNVYLHWEFHRKPIYACSTYFARPYIIDVGQKSAPPRIAPPKQPNDEKPPARPKNESGEISRDTDSKG